MSSFLLTLLSPVITAVALVLAAVHHLVSALGLDPSSAAAWASAVIGLVLVVRTALLPLLVLQVRQSRAGRRAAPELDRIRRRYAGRTEPEAIRAQLAELREVRSRHGIGMLRSAPLLVQIPVLSALTLLLLQVDAGHPVAAMSPALVASARAAQSGVAASLPVHLGLIALTAAVTYLASRRATRTSLAQLPTSPAPDPAAEATQQAMAGVLRSMPAIAAVGLVVSGLALPSGVLLCWLASASWTAAQQRVVEHLVG